MCLLNSVCMWAVVKFYFKFNSFYFHAYGIDVSLNDSTKSTQINFDALAFVRLSMGANQMYEIILKSIERNISCVQANVTNVKRPLYTFVFYPKVLGHFISYVYPTTSADDGKYAKSSMSFLK